MNKSTRKLKVVSGMEIVKEKFPTLYEFAVSEEVMEAFREISDNPKLKYGIQPNLFPCHINFQQEPNNHHGWHLDDAGYKLVIQTTWKPGPNETGGNVGLIRNYVAEEHKYLPVQERLDKLNPEIKTYSLEEDKENRYSEIVTGHRISKDNIKVLNLIENESYFMEGRRSSHCVFPLTDNTKRVTVCYSFDDVHDGSNYLSSADQLYQQNFNDKL
eukprot:CAMPEP_0170528358 /NCGR_PEP_ID=MMETSP0209-20121228/13853_1 /TAXON_ID=665100 ORGANISM="Litonotus pictus, Strain P1" /NCGR_SAMPLE_ID=MMETSP0209 /ASSEMBLY_ACC=CAM_ASM_000301 /LENGTH=214 /DNA_ID=CAMNT_0010819525 /DNA_START=187 /DNA_END=831 /DNA_ORIENTATION=+